MTVALTDEKVDPAEPADSSALDAGSTADVAFTDRERAIIAGDDPDLSTPTEQAQPGNDAGKEPKPAMDATGGGTEAARAAPSEAQKPADSWYTADHKALAESYGLTEDDAKSFASEDEFNRATLLFDRQLVTAAAQRSAQEKAEADAATKPLAKPDDGTKASPPAAQLADDDELDPQKYIDAGYDENTVKLVKLLKTERDRNRERDVKFEEVQKGLEEFKATSQREAETQQHGYKIKAFHDIADSLSESRFGKSIDAAGRPVQITAEADAARRKLYEMTDILIAGIEERARQTGQQPALPPYQLLAKRAEALVFAEEIRKEQQEQLRTRITEQSKRRRPVAAHKYVPAAQAGASGVDEATRLINDPKLKARYETALEESGAVEHAA